MKDCYCTECGGNMKEHFRVSIGGLYQGQNSYALYVMLNEHVRPNWNRVAEEDFFNILKKFDMALEESYMKSSDGEKIKEETAPKGERTRRQRKRNLEENQEELLIPALPAVPPAPEPEIVQVDYDKLRSNPNAKEYLEVLAAADKYDKLDLVDYLIDIRTPESEACRKFVWAQLILRKFQEVLSHKYRMIQYLMAVNYEGQENWYNMDLLACFSDENCRDIAEELSTLMTDQSYQEEYRVMNELKKIVRTADEFRLDFDKCPKKWKSLSFHEMKAEEAEETHGTEKTKKYLTGFTFGPQNESIYLRICPHCGKHISSFFGMYPQKIISFIGTPASGKSTIINAIYTFLHDNKYIDCQLPVYDPNYAAYEYAYNRIVYHKLAVKKTDMGTYPSLTVCLTIGKKTMLYTFVDVPGEHFIDTTAHKKVFDFAADMKANMQHLRIMNRSDVLCVVMASEQLFPVNAQDSEHSMATADGRELETFKVKVQQFKNIVLNMKKIPVFFLFSKPDALPFGEDDFKIVNEETVWMHSRQDALIKRTTIETFMSELRDDSSLILKNSSGAPVINLQKLLNQQRVTHDLVQGINSQMIQSLLNNISNILTEDRAWESVPSFMISPFGFYALNTAFKMSAEEKLSAFQQSTRTNGLSPQELHLLCEADENNDMVQELKGQVPDGEPRSVSEVQEKYGLTIAEIEQILENYYFNLHSTDDMYGMAQFIDWLMVCTGMCDFVCDEKHVGNTAVLLENAVRCKELFQYQKDFHDNDPHQSQREELREQIQAKEKEILEKQKECENTGGFLGRLLNRDRKAQEALETLNTELEALKSRLNAIPKW